MFLVKCKCGCRLTLNDSHKEDEFRCPNCWERIYMDKVPRGEEQHAESISHIPDNAKITVTFDT